MTNTELIRQEIERRIGAMYNFSEGYSALNVCRELLDFIDSLPKESEKGMNWRTDKPTANVIVALVRYDDDIANGLQITSYDFRVLEKKADDFYIDFHSDREHIPTDQITKWADLEEEETVTDCYQLEEAAEKYIEELQGQSDFPSMFDAYLTNLCHILFKAGANWQKEQNHYACRQCEKDYDNVFFKREQHAIKMMKEEAIEASCFGGKEGEEHIVTFVVPYFRIKDYYTLGNKAKLYIFKDNKE